MTAPIIVGVDLGTQRLKVAAVDASSWRLIGSEQTPLQRYTNTDGQYEQDPDSWWQGVRDLIPRLLHRTRIEPKQVAGIGLSGTMHSIVPLDGAGDPVYRCILWLDTRSAADSDAIGQRFAGRLWNPSVSAYSAPKLVWLKREVPEAFGRLRHVLFPKDYLRFRLTGTMATDLSDASGSQLWDFDTCDWDDEVAAAVGLGRERLPSVEPSAEVAGTVTERAGSELGLPPGIPVAYGVGDVAAAIVGSGASARDGFLYNVGTAAQVIRTMATAARYSRERGARFLFETGTPGQRFVMGALPSAGLSLDWWARASGMGGAPEDLDAVAAPASSAGEAPFFAPYLTGTGTPMLDESSIGAFLRLSADAGRADMTRAVMEGVAYAIRRCADALMTDANNDASGPSVVTGGVTKSPRMREILGALLRGSVQFRDVADASLVGAVAVAAAAIGIVDTPERAAARLAPGEQQVNPDADLMQRLENGYREYLTATECLTRHGT